MWNGYILHKCSVKLLLYVWLNLIFLIDKLTHENLTLLLQHTNCIFRNVGIPPFFFASYNSSLTLLNISLRIFSSPFSLPLSLSVWLFKAKFKSKSLLVPSPRRKKKADNGKKIHHFFGELASKWKWYHISELPLTKKKSE